MWRHERTHGLCERSADKTLNVPEHLDFSQRSLAHVGVADRVPETGFTNAPEVIAKVFVLLVDSVVDASDEQHIVAREATVHGALPEQVAFFGPAVVFHSGAFGFFAGELTNLFLPLRVRALEGLDKALKARTAHSVEDEGAVVEVAQAPPKRAFGVSTNFYHMSHHYVLLSVFG